MSHLCAIGAFLGPFIVAFARSAVHSAVALRPTASRLSVPFRAIGFSKGKTFSASLAFQAGVVGTRPLSRAIAFTAILSSAAKGTSDGRLLVFDAGFDARKTVKYGIRQSFL